MGRNVDCDRLVESTKHWFANQHIVFNGGAQIPEGGGFGQAASMILLRFRRDKPQPKNQFPRTLWELRDRPISGEDLFGSNGVTSVKVIFQPRSAAAQSDPQISIGYVRVLQQVLSGLSDDLAREGLIYTRFVTNADAEALTQQWFPGGAAMIQYSKDGGDLKTGSANGTGFTFNLW